MSSSYCFDRILGLSPYKTLTFSRATHSITVFFILILFLKYTLEGAIDDDSTTKLGTFVLLTRIFCISTTAFISFFVILKNNFHIIEMERDLRQVTSTIGKFVEVKSIRIPEALQAAFIVFVVVVEIVFSHWDGISLYIYLFIGVNLVIQSRFVSGVFRIRNSYLALNDTLLGLCKTTNFKIVVPVSPLGNQRRNQSDGEFSFKTDPIFSFSRKNINDKSPRYIVSTISKLRRNLLLICDRYNSCYSIPVLLSIGTYTTNITLELYRLYKSRKESPVPLLVMRNLFPATWNLIVISAIVLVCSMTVQEVSANKTNMIFIKNRTYYPI